MITLTEIYNQCLLREELSLSERYLHSLKPKFIVVAQKIYDDWEQDDEGFDDLYGVGGICDDIADKFCEIIYNSNDEFICTTIYDAHNYHTSVYVANTNTKELYHIDLPYYHYEKGAGYNWEKIPNVTFDVSMIEINDISHDYEEYIEDDNFKDFDS
jgi:hypothetical protein